MARGGAMRYSAAARLQNVIKVFIPIHAVSKLIHYITYQENHLIKLVRQSLTIKQF